MDIELTELKKEFLDEALAKVIEIRSRLDEKGTTPSRESVQRMIDLAHQLKGAGGSYGYSKISTYAARLEDTLESLADGGSDEYSSLERLIEPLSTEVSERRAELDEVIG